MGVGLPEDLLAAIGFGIDLFDCVIPTPIPDKGKILTQLSLFWFDFTKNIIPNHILTTNVDEYPEELRKYKDILDKRSALVKKAELIEGVERQLRVRIYRQRPIASAVFSSCFLD